MPVETTTLCTNCFSKIASQAAKENVSYKQIMHKLSFIVCVVKFEQVDKFKLDCGVWIHQGLNKSSQHD